MSLEVDKIAEALRSTYKDNLGKMFGAATNKALVAEEVFVCQSVEDDVPPPPPRFEQNCCLDDDDPEINALLADHGHNTEDEPIEELALVEAHAVLLELYWIQNWLC